MKGNFNFLTLFLKVEIHQNIIPRETIDHTIGDKYTNFIYMSQKQILKVLIIYLKSAEHQFISIDKRLRTRYTLTHLVDVFA